MALSATGLPFSSSGSGLRVGLCLVLLALLGGALLIPLNMVNDLVYERAERSRQVESDLAGQWGSEQTVAGPVLLVPYTVWQIPANGGAAQAATHYAHVLPERLTVAAGVDPEHRYKSIYDVLLYASRIHLEARFAPPDLAGKNVAPGDIRWSDASLVLGVSDSRGVRGLAATLDGKTMTMLPGTPKGALFPVGAHARLGDSGPTGHAVAIDLTLDGIRRLAFLPVGSDSAITLESPWPHPDFVGGFLPAERTIRPDGFAARWSISALSRAYPVLWLDDELDFAKVDDGAVGVRLVQPGDAYQQADRVTKYGVLVIALTFAAIFLVGLWRGGQAHPVQYALVGAALCLFYLLLLSLAEHIAFGWAYLIAAVVDLAMVALYVGATVGRIAGWTLAGLLALVQGYIYVLLGLEDYALLAGTVGLLVMLTVIMVLTRRIDWYALDTTGPKRAGAAG
jgi:inner membrane protein